VSPVRGLRPSLSTERALFTAGHRVVAGMDEVGRGALAGPVSVGVALVDARTGRIPSGLRDSKLLAPEVRERLVPRITQWSAACAVGHAGPDEIDAHGIIAALRLAGLRALAALPVTPDVVLLDGNFDWLGRGGQAGLFDEIGDDAGGSTSAPPVVTRIKADLTCASVAAASVLAKTERDAHMVSLAPRYPAFAWAENKGYAAPVHLEALDAVGPCDQHRRTWRLRGTDQGVDALTDGDAADVDPPTDPVPGRDESWEESA
jgi:ribonuclease HII